MRRGGRVTHDLAAFVVVVLALAMLARTGTGPRRRGHRPAWTASHRQYEVADWLEKAAAHYRAGRRGRAEGVLMNPLIDWDLIAVCAARARDLRAETVAEMLAAPNGERAFQRELRRSDSSECAAVLGVLAAALRAVPDPATRDRIS